jgi:hypothetical protein
VAYLPTSSIHLLEGDGSQAKLSQQQAGAANPRLALQ